MLVEIFQPTGSTRLPNRVFFSLFLFFSLPVMCLQRGLASVPFYNGRDQQNLRWIATAVHVTKNKPYRGLETCTMNADVTLAFLSCARNPDGSAALPHKWFWSDWQTFAGILRPFWKLNLRFHYWGDLWCILEKAVKDVDASVEESAASGPPPPPPSLTRIRSQRQGQKDNSVSSVLCFGSMNHS